jgi:hypothetical protein
VRSTTRSRKLASISVTATPASGSRTSAARSRPSLCRPPRLAEARTETPSLRKQPVDLVSIHVDCETDPRVLGGARNPEQLAQSHGALGLDGRGLPTREVGYVRILAPPFRGENHAALVDEEQSVVRRRGRDRLPFLDLRSRGRECRRTIASHPGRPLSAPRRLSCRAPEAGAMGPTSRDLLRTDGIGIAAHARSQIEVGWLTTAVHAEVRGMKRHAPPPSTATERTRPSSRSELTRHLRRSGRASSHSPTSLTSLSQVHTPLTAPHDSSGRERPR